MLPCPLPPWLRALVVQAVADYTKTAALCEQRCVGIAAAGRRGQDGRFCDDAGSIDEYRMDAKYCAGMATRLPALLEETLTASERDKILREITALENGNDQHSREIPRDPRVLAQWAWENPWKDMVVPMPPPPDAIREVRTNERLQVLSQREAEALILCRGLRMTSEEAAPIMDIKPEAVRRLVNRARHRLEGQEEDT